MGYIYKITNDVNNKVYIGQTRRSIAERWSVHKYRFQNKKNCPLYRAMEKLGVEHFNIELIEECPNDKLIEHEKYWIKQYNSYLDGYNGNIGGDGLHKYDEDEIYKLWDEGLTVTEIKKKYGISKQILRKILQKYEPYLTEKEERYLLSRSRIKSKSRAVRQYSLEGELICEYPSIAEASRQTGAHKMAIIHSCQENFRTAKGYRWKYVNENDDIPFKKRKLPVNQFDLEGNLINSFESLTDVSRKMDINESSLSQAIKKGVKYKGYIWKPA